MVSTPSSSTGASWSEIVDPTPIYTAPISTTQQGAPSVAPLPGLRLHEGNPSWSEIVDPTSIYTAPISTPQQGANSVAPLPGLCLPDAGSIWNPPQPNFPTLPQVPGNVRMPALPLGEAPPCRLN